MKTQYYNVTLWKEPFCLMSHFIFGHFLYILLITVLYFDFRNIFEFRTVTCRLDYGTCALT